MKLFEAGIFDEKDRPFRVKEVADWFKAVELLKALQDEVGSEGLVVWVPCE